MTAETSYEHYWKAKCDKNRFIVCAFQLIRNIKAENNEMGK